MDNNESSQTPKLSVMLHLAATIGAWLALIGYIVMITNYINKMEQRIAITEQWTVMQRERDNQQDNAVSNALTQIRDAVRENNSKLDRLIERGLHLESLPKSGR